ncbi:DUF4199 domain-containing protein [Chitinophaga filiformis]|uniref:DUF4199 domain-containing protein n=1 Tax=Chitinophaga filiformis TaxID=104663 RepID=UPI001F44747E|nr:DUF4199 domain-containing protein [Chitinophaga filiformis]MCF6406906.1 DUF4199 domain-containing protein [Chitinophaga filiformis]
MKKNVLIFGLISGLIITTMMVATSLSCYNNPEGFKGNEVVGYAGMLIAFAFIFVGIKNYRDRYNQGTITFGKAFKVGFYIALVASTFYVLTWLVEYYLFVPDFMDKYTAHVMNEARTSGATEAELAAKAKNMEWYQSMYKSPIFVILLTFAEVLPLGIVVALISALILKRRSRRLSGVLSN